jgi:CheY-like chemotaxis protein
MDPKPNLLLVEDEDMLRNLIRDLLESKGYTVQAASGGEEALALAKRPEQRIDLVLTDVMMPHMMGNELIDRLRQLFPGVKVIFMSGYTGSNNPSIQQAWGMPGVVFLQKPFRLHTLLDHVKALMGAAAP